VFARVGGDTSSENVPPSVAERSGTEWLARVPFRNGDMGSGKKAKSSRNEVCRVKRRRLCVEAASRPHLNSAVSGIADSCEKVAGPAREGSRVGSAGAET